MTTLMNAARLQAGMVAAVVAGLALSSVVLGVGRVGQRQAAQSGVETPPVGTVTRDREHAALPAVEPVGRRLQREVLPGHHPDGGDGFGHRHLRRRERHRRHRRLGRLPVAERRHGQPGPA